jgi:CubicO group peptidase (beta-lactamase class C family)
MKNRILLFSLLFVCSIVSAGELVKVKPSKAGFDGDRLDRIDKMIQGCVDRSEVPGAVAILIKNGKIGYHKAFGWADIDSRKPVEKRSLFRIASMSKLITTVAALQLFEKGHFDLNTPLGDILPEFVDQVVLKSWDEGHQAFVTEPAKRPILMRHLFTHTSGIVYPIFTDEGRAGYLAEKITDAFPNGQITLEENIKRLAGVPLAHEPGERFTYGMNMDVLGRVVEVLDGRPFAKYMRDEIFEVLEMDDTGFSVKRKKQDRVVTVYTTRDDELAVYDDEVIAELAPNNYKEWWEEDSDVIAMGGAGIISSAYDYARFLQMLLNGGELGGERILGRKTVELLSRGLYQSDPNASTAIGLSVSVVMDASKHYHPESEGAYNWGGYFYTSFWVDPKEGFIGVLMSQVNPTKSRMGGQFKIMAYSALE